MALGIYVHIPFCASRCGYCDFNTYTAAELGAGVRQSTFHEVLLQEIRMAATEIDGPASTVFFGGGTPTLIGADALNALLDGVRTEIGLAPDAEITCEANPDSIDASGLERLRAGGFTRMSFGMQSAAKHVLRVLERTHTPGAARAAARSARAAGFEHVSLDLIYGTPGESEADLDRSLEEVLASGVDHVSAYALIVEPGTPLARRVERGEIPAPDDDVAADRYLRIDERLSAAGMDWYEVSNWALPGGQCRHNLGYWANDDWWGIGPGAHSHRAGVRWWNHKHPRTYAQALGSGEQPVAGREVLTEQQRQTESIMLAVRTSDGLPAADLPALQLHSLLQRGLLDGEALDAGCVRLTRSGRLLADGVVRALLPEHASP